LTPDTCAYGFEETTVVKLRSPEFGKLRIGEPGRKVDEIACAFVHDVKAIAAAAEDKIAL
jgi:hypothetical protein